MAQLYPLSQFDESDSALGDQIGFQHLKKLTAGMIGG